jgi:DNA polymerase-3 subunit epsilon
MPNSIADGLLAQGITAETVGDILASSPSGLVLAFDTETTGLPLWHEPSDGADQPHVVQLAMELCTAGGEVIEVYDRIINIGIPIPPEMTAIHGITDEMAAAGIDPKQALADFFAFVERADVVTGFNVSLDLRMMRIQSARHLGQKWDCPKSTFDTCFAATSVCRIPAKPGARSKFKKPNLTEAVRHFFGEDHAGAHNALHDATAARRLYFALRDTMEAKNPRAIIGGNSPPADEPATVEEPAVVDDGLTDFERVKKEIEDLYDDGEAVSRRRSAGERGAGG